MFSSGNVFEGNIANYSNYGFWLGYSTDTTVRGNEIRANRFDGVAIEHGRDNRIEDNRIERNRNGIRLWSDGAPEGKDSGNVARRYVISCNQIEDSRECGILVTDDHDVDMTDNGFQRNQRDFVRQVVGG